MKQPSVSVVIPAYNEEDVIRRSLQKVLEFMDENYDDYEVILVDDGSTDSTLDIAKLAEKDHSKLRVIDNPHSGKGYTVKTGILAATKNYVLFSDADLATPIEDLKRFLVWIQEHNFDIVIASREDVGAERHGEPFIRHLMGRVFNLIVQALLLRGINDTQCGFKLFKASAAKRVFEKTRLYPGTEIDVPLVTAFDVEVLYIAQKMGYKIKSVPVTWSHREASKVRGVQDSFNNLRDVIKVKVNDIRGLYD